MGEFSPQKSHFMLQSEQFMPAQSLKRMYTPYLCQLRYAFHNFYGQRSRCVVVRRNAQRSGNCRPDMTEMFFKPAGYVQGRKVTTRLHRALPLEHCSGDKTVVLANHLPEMELKPLSFILLAPKRQFKQFKRIFFLIFTSLITTEHTETIHLAFK